MSVLTTLKKDHLGDWPSVADYLRDLRRRETNSVAALAVMLGAAPEEHRELAKEGLAILVEVASDLRIPKTSRVAAARCALEAGAAGGGGAAPVLGAGGRADGAALGSGGEKP